MRKKNNWLVLSIIFSFGWALIYIDRTMLNPILIEVLKEFEIGKDKIGIVFSLFFLGYTIFQIPGGLLGDRFGDSKVIKYSFLFLSLLSLISGFELSFFSFMILRTISGSIEGLYYGPQFSYTSKIFNKENKVFGTTIINCGMALGMILGAILPTYLVINKGLNFRYLFYILSILTLLLYLFMENFVKENKKTVVIEKFKINKELVKVFFISFTSLYAFFNILTWLPIYLSNEKMMSSNEVVFYISIIPFISIISSLFFSKLIDKYRKINLFIKILLFFTIISILLLIISFNYILLMIALIIYGVFGKLALDPILIVAVSNNNENENLSTTLAIFNFVGLLSSVLVPYIGTKIYFYTNKLGLSFIFSILLLLISLIISFSLRKEK